MQQRNFLSALFYSIRPSACAGVSLFATASLGRWDDLITVSLTFFSAFIGASGCFLINDIFDREKDLKNKKLRPIATGQISVGTASILSVLFCATMLVTAAFLSLKTLILACLLIFCFWIYSYINRHFGLLANIWVAICSSFAFLFGAFVYDISPLVYAAMLCTFFVNIAREIMLDALDDVGDKAVGKPSMVLSYGAHKTKKIIAFLFVLGSIPLLTYANFNPSTIPWFILSMLLLWIPFLFMKKNESLKVWALFNVRTSHLFFLAIIILLFSTPLSANNKNYNLKRLDSLPKKNDNRY